MPKKSKEHEFKSQAYKLFANYGHDCTLENISDNYDWEYAPGHSIWAKFKRWIIRMVVVSESSKFYTHHLRSFGAISKERRRQLKNYPAAIHPFSTGRIIWAIVMIIVILLQLITIPFEFLLFSFDNKYHFNIYWNIISFFCELILYFNIIINCLTGYYDEPMQKVVLNCKQIFLHYLKTYLVMDVLSAMPLHIELYKFASQDTVAPLMWLKLFKFLLVVSFNKYTKIVANNYNINHYTLMTFMVIFYTVIFWHIMCCVVGFIRINIIHYHHTGAPLFKDYRTFRYTTIGDRSVWVRYFNALHHKSLLLYNSGYGKTLPVDELEIVLIYCVWYGSSLFCIFILAMIMEINTGKTSSAHKYDEMERQLKEYMRHKQLPTHMRRRILTYYEFKFQKRYFRENEILSTISEQLRQDIYNKIVSAVSTYKVIIKQDSNLE